MGKLEANVAIFTLGFKPPAKWSDIQALLVIVILHMLESSSLHTANIFLHFLESTLVFYEKFHLNFMQ